MVVCRPSSVVHHQNKQTMNKLVKFFLPFLFFIAVFSLATAQPFSAEIAAFKKQDSISFPPQHAILFVGSSSFAFWKDVQDYFPGYTIINRGFGGSSLPDAIRYVNDIIVQYHPKQIVIYCGENDLAASDTVTPKDVLERFKTLFQLIREKLPRVSIAYISIKPSPSRERLSEKMIQANKSIKNFLSKQKETAYIDVYTKMLGKDHKARPELFISDRLHMNKTGYVIWQKAIRPYLKK